MTIEEIKRGETDRVEFKREVPQKDKRYLKTVVAFANGLGGSVVFGIDDKTLDVVGVLDDNLRKMEDGLTREEMLTGKSKLRNPVLADIFHKMGIIEK